MNVSRGKSKLTLESLLQVQQVITGKKLIEKVKAAKKEADRQKAILDEAIEFERRNRKSRN